MKKSESLKSKKHEHVVQLSSPTVMGDPPLEGDSTSNGNERVSYWTVSSVL